MAQSSCQTLDVNGSMAIESTGNDVESAKQVAGRCLPVSSFLGIEIRKVLNVRLVFLFADPDL